ncbi:MAG: hypothetical protein ACRC2S_28035 [Waterburya sp.]
MPSGLKITGSVVAEQVRTLDLSQRWWETTSVVVEKDFVDSVIHIINQIVS